MYKRFHDRFGTAGVVIGVIALIAALGGSALAAGGLTKTQEKQVTKIAKKYAGKNGTNGTNGTNGEKGAQGEKGPQGTPGANGKSVVAGVEAKGANCKEGGSNFEVEGSGTKKYACNGEPWTAGGTLPSGQTETGAWILPHPISGTESIGAINFPIPLTVTDAAAISHVPVSDHVKVMKKGAASPPSGCTGGSLNNPKANPGFFCIYIGEAVGFNATEEATTVYQTNFTIQGVNTSGALIFNSLQASGFGTGTWAVTTP